MADQVNVISTCKVKMANSNANNSHHISRVELTPWDLKSLPLHPIQKGLFFFYKPKSTPESRKTFINHLKNTLSLALDYFPLLAGRLAKINDGDTTHFFVDCNNAGATFTHASAHGVRVHDILGPVHTPVIVRSLFSLNGVTNYDSHRQLLGVQVTELVDGFFIACSINHCVADGTSFWHFFNSWSEISRGSSKISKVPLFERSSINDFSSINFPIPVPEIQPTNILDNLSQPSYIERIFRFEKGSLSKLKAKANSEAGTNTISTLQALLAHTWRAMIRSRGVTHLDQQLFCAILIGTRQRLPLPDVYFGNAVYLAPVSMKSKDLVHKGLGWVALEINKIVSIQTRNRALKELEKDVEFVKIDPSSRKQLVLIGSTPRHNVYGVDFGLGKAVAVRSGPATKFDGKINVYPSSDEDGGIDVEVCLAEESLVAMGNDAEFMEPLTI